MVESAGLFLDKPAAPADVEAFLQQFRFLLVGADLDLRLALRLLLRRLVQRPRRLECVGIEDNVNTVECDCWPRWSGSHRPPITDPDSCTTRRGAGSTGTTAISEEHH